MKTAIKSLVVFAASGSVVSVAYGAFVYLQATGVLTWLAEHSLRTI